MALWALAHQPWGHPDGCHRLHWLQMEVGSPECSACISLVT